MTVDTSFHFSTQEYLSVKEKLLRWASTQSPNISLNSNAYAADNFGKYDCLIAVGAKRRIQADHSSNRAHLIQCLPLIASSGTWWFGYMSYDLKDHFHGLSSDNSSNINFPLFFFFEPEIVLTFRDCTIQVYGDVEKVKSVIDHSEEVEKTDTPPIFFKPRLSKNAYLKTIDLIQREIRNGEVYELNFCQEFYAQPQAFHPFSTYCRMNAATRMPFSAYCNLDPYHIMCCSPERFVQRTGSMITSQPIKGTAKKGITPEQNAQQKDMLFTSEKDRAENVMIVDLVRNDLARICQTGSVHVPELFGIYEFDNIIQMISTVRGHLKPSVSLFDILQALFPMGSMTGAPKIRAMQLIDHYENFKRGPYSGMLGYIEPNGGFDFNVLIRSLFYDKSQNYLSYPVGGAIVYDSEPLKEYNECLLKAQTIFENL